MSRRRVVEKAKRSPKDNFLQQKNIAPYDRFLILCEDSKCAPAYLKKIIKDYLHLPLQAFVVDGTCPNTPLEIISYAESKVKEMKRRGDEPFDNIYCVFDRDQHENYSSALNKISELNKKFGNKPQFIRADSAPCFEFWILLHFDNSDKPLQNCDVVVKQIKRFNADFTKKDSSKIFNTDLFDKTVNAIANARKLSEATQAHNASNNNVFSNMSTLLTDLLEQSKRIPR